MALTPEPGAAFPPTVDPRPGVPPATTVSAAAVTMPSDEITAAERPSRPVMPAPATTRRPRKAPREPLYFSVILLLIADIVFGLGLAVFADKVIGFRPMAIVGLGLAGLGLGILAYFVIFGSGKPKR